MNRIIMKETFQINRIYLLIKRFFVENFKSELIYWGIMILAFMIMYKIEQHFFEYIIFASLFADRVNKDFSKKTNSIHYLMLPASRIEKLSSMILLIVPLFFVLFISAHFVASQLLNIIYHVTTGKVYYNSIFEGSAILFSFIGTREVLGMLLVSAIALVGSLHFRKNQALRTWLSIWAIFIMLVLLFVVVGFVFFKNKVGFSLNEEFSDTLYSLEDLLTSSVSIFIYKTLAWLSIPYLWLVSYFKLSEKEA